MFELFVKGGPIMWPLLVTSIIALTVVIERVLFLIRTQKNRNPELEEKIFAYCEQEKISEAIEAGKDSRDYVVRVLVYGLEHREWSFSNALLQAANQELKRFDRGISTLDTIITLAPLLGLLGTVTGMIRSFSLLGNRELEAPAAITGGIAEALIATAFGLSIAIIALIPYNYLNSKLEQARHEIEDASTRLELLLIKPVQTHENSFSAK